MVKLSFVPAGTESPLLKANEDALTIFWMTVHLIFSLKPSPPSHSSFYRGGKVSVGYMIRIWSLLDKLMDVSKVKVCLATSPTM